MSDIRSDIINAEWSDCLNRLREARALVLRDAESFHEASMVLERVGQVLCGEIRKGLSQYRDELVTKAVEAEGVEQEYVERLFYTVKDARNMAVHEGAWARNFNSRLVDLILILEQAIMKNMKTAADIMVRNPIVAETWQMIGHIRQTMLANSFSSLPVLVNSQWFFISDAMVMSYLRNTKNGRVNEKLLSTQLGTANEQKEIPLLEARCFSPTTELKDLVTKMDAGAALITENTINPPRLLGIVTSFDLL